MVTAVVNTPPSGLNSECLTRIDISSLSQSELQALSLCSEALFDLCRTEDLVVPHIDRFLFNESAGSRRQTYSRLRLRPSSATPSHHRARLPGLLPSVVKHPPAVDPENKSIVNYLKQLLHGKCDSGLTSLPLVHSGHTEAVPEAVRSNGDGISGLGSPSQEMEIVLHSCERKRKRGRKPKVKKLQENGIGVDVDVDIANKNGVVVDLAALGISDDLYGEELRRRTVGLETEEQVLGFLRGLEGQWGSRRRKRKIVDADEFGDLLPTGWKLLLGLRRREGRVSVYCRRYMSPTGQQFLSCKEVASYLQSYFGFNSPNQPLDSRNGSVDLTDGVPVISHAGFVHKTDAMKHDAISNSYIPGPSISAVDGKELSLTEIDNLPDVQVQDLFECYKCNLTFDEKNAYLQHLLSFHQRTTRRYRLGTSVGEGVIIKDGKYECQFCHKVFQERRSYNGHVGIHVRNYVRGSEEPAGLLTVDKSTGSPSLDVLAPKISKMDALIEIAQNSILEPSSAEPDNKLDGGSPPNLFNVEEKANSDLELTLGSHPSEKENCRGEIPLNQEFNEPGSNHMNTNAKIMKIDGASKVENNVDVISISIVEPSSVDEVNKYENSNLEIHLEKSDIKPDDVHVMETIERAAEAKALHSGTPDFSVPMVQPACSFPAFPAVPHKEGNELCSVGQKLESVTGFEELRLDEIETLKYGFANGQASPSLPEVSVEVANHTTEEEGFNSSVRFESEAAVLDLDGGHQVSTVCVWCRTEFNHEAIESEPQSDSIGFMCPACKAKISGHLDGGLSTNFDQCAPHSCSG